MKLVQTEDYLLLINEEAEIKKGDYILEKESIINIFPDYLTDLDECTKIIAYRPLTKEVKELDLPLLPPFEDGVNIGELAENIRKDKYHDNSVEYPDYNIGFEDGYRSAQYKQFSLEDIKKAFEAGVAWHVNPNISEIDAYTSFIQSLSTQQFPSEFIPEYQKDWEETTKMFMESMGDNPEDFKYEETLKTITNSESKEILVGIYKY